MSVAAPAPARSAGLARTRALFHAAAQHAADQLAPLRGTALHLSGASGFLAANLLALLYAASVEGDLGLRLHASARRPIEDVALFAFLGVRPAVAWEVAPVERTTLPAEPGLTVIHAASPAAPADYLRAPLATFRANTDGVIALFEQAARTDAGHVVYFSSAEVYGTPPAADLPTAEGYGGAPDLGLPRSIYAESKRMAEVLGASLAERHAIPFTALRPFNLYGPGQRRDDGRVPLAFVAAARDGGPVALSSDGTPCRCPCFVWDGLLQIVAALAPPPEARARAFNVGDPTQELTMLDLARRVSDAVTVGPPPPAGVPVRAQPDVRAIQRHATPALPPFTPLDDGLATLDAWLGWLDG